MPLSLPFRQLAWGSAVAAASIYSVLVYDGISLVPRRDITTTVDSIAPSFRSSHTLAKLVNPRSLPFQASDIHHTTVCLPLASRNISDEALLAYFTRGFFGGWVLAPERWALTILNHDFTRLSGSPATSREYAVATLSRDALPPLNTLLFGTFQVVDVHLGDEDPGRESRGTASHVDIAYGKDTSSFAGAHRFSVSRTPEDRREGKVAVTFASASCNPTAPSSPMLLLLGPFHRMYAMLLFRESVAAMKRAAGGLES